ncbi:MAG: rhodanese-like domain-containing protein [Pseudomonadota bacterium]
MSAQLIALLATLNMAFIFDSYRYIEPDQFKTWLESNKPMHIVDIQVEKEFVANHFPGSIATYAFPVETGPQRKQLDATVVEAKKNNNEVVIVCPRGGGGAKRTYDYLKAGGVAEARLFILKGGMEKWPHRQMLKSGK